MWSTLVPLRIQRRGAEGLVGLVSRVTSSWALHSSELQPKAALSSALRMPFFFFLEEEEEL